VSQARIERKETGLARKAVTTGGPTIAWFRQDLRLADNPALTAACASGAPVIPVFVLDDATPGVWRPGGASRWWLHGSLAALADDLAARGAALVLRRGAAEAVIPALVAEMGATQVFWNRCYEPHAVARDTRLKAALTAADVAVESYSAALLHEPWTLRTGAGAPFKVFTPFWRAARAAARPSTPLPAPGRIVGAAAASETLDSWSLQPRRPDWAAGLRATWTPGEAAAQARLTDFLRDGLHGYAAARDRPDLPGASRLSAHLHWGEIGPRQIWAAVEAFVAAHPGVQAYADKFLAEIGWREFAAHLLFHDPALPDRPWRDAFDSFPWATDDAAINSWQHGRTGYPIVDAGMRELWATGFMHNRVRMIVASFLVKDLMIHWRRGEEWFWDTLVDADLASNAAGWQWVAGSGADAAPYFRIFNPVTQGERYDPEGVYVRRWVPELAKLPNACIHAPWLAPPATLAAAGVALGETYPKPVVDHAVARRRALAAYKSMSGAAHA
jgi:deoxyribodipyrimidine photo-lyase